MMRSVIVASALLCCAWLVRAQGLPAVALDPPIPLPPAAAAAVQQSPAAVPEPAVPAAQAVGCIRSPQRCSCFDQVGQPVTVAPGLCAQLTDVNAPRLAGGDLSRFEARPVELVPDPVFPAPLPQYGLRYALDTARSIVGRR